MPRDPVCLMVIHQTQASLNYTYGDKTFYFCAKACLEKFQKDPSSYIERHGELLEEGHCQRRQKRLE